MVFLTSDWESWICGSSVSLTMGGSQRGWRSDIRWKFSSVAGTRPSEVSDCVALEYSPSEANIAARLALYSFCSSSLVFFFLLVSLRRLAREVIFRLSLHNCTHSPALQRRILSRMDWVWVRPDRRTLLSFGVAGRMQKGKT